MLGFAIWMKDDVCVCGICLFASSPFLLLSPKREPKINKKKARKKKEKENAVGCLTCGGEEGNLGKESRNRLGLRNGEMCRRRRGIGKGKKRRKIGKMKNRPTQPLLFFQVQTKKKSHFFFLDPFFFHLFHARSTALICTALTCTAAPAPARPQAAVRTPDGAAALRARRRSWRILDVAVVLPVRRR